MTSKFFSSATDGTDSSSKEMDAQKSNVPSSHNSDVVFSESTADKPSPPILGANENKEQQLPLQSAPLEVKELGNSYRKPMEGNSKSHVESPPKAFKCKECVQVNGHEFIITGVLPDSGQAKPYTCINSSSKEKVFMKVYSRNDSVTKSRFQKECDALSSLGNDKFKNQIPKLICSEFPILVMDYIPGCTLQEFKKNYEGDVDASVEFVIQLLELLKAIHEIGIYHRDIKPSNIMLRDEKLEHPVLVDFGLVWCLEKNTPITLLGENPGNRFMDLPEAFSENAWENHSAVSDITRACGILFWLLTGKQPNGFVNANGRIHECKDVLPNLIEELKKIKNKKLDVLTLFDSMFQLSPHHRLQSADQCLKVINGLAPDKLGETIAELDVVSTELKKHIKAAFPDSGKNRSNIVFKEGWLQKKTEKGLMMIKWHLVTVNKISNPTLADRRKSSQALKGKYVCVNGRNGKVYWIQDLQNVPSTFGDWLKSNAFKSESSSGEQDDSSGVTEKSESSSGGPAVLSDVTEKFASMSTNDSAVNEKSESSSGEQDDPSDVTEKIKAGGEP